MRVLVTGGAGFIGSNFVEMALTDQFPNVSSVIVLDKLTYAGKLSNLANVSSHPKFEFTLGDICDVELVNDLATKVDAIINFAAESHVDRSIEDSSEFIRTNVLGTQVLLDAAKKHKVKKFVQVSTDEVYGSILEGSWDEDQPLLPNSPYSASKAAADLLVRAYFVTHGLNVNVPVYGDGLNVRDWLYVEDHCKGIYLALTKGISGEIYNIGGGTELTNLDLTSKLLSVLEKAESCIEFVEDRLGHDRRYSVDSSKIEKLGYTSSEDFEKNLKRTVDWYLKSFNLAIR